MPKSRGRTKPQKSRKNSNDPEIIDFVSAKIIERYIVMWLQGTELGQSILVEFSDRSLNETVDAVFNLLNAGFLKIRMDRRTQALTGIEPRIPPRPPHTQIQRIQLQ